MKRIDIFTLAALVVLPLLAIYVYYAPPSHENGTELILATGSFESRESESGGYRPGHAEVWVVKPGRRWLVDVITDTHSDVAHKAIAGDFDMDGLNEICVACGRNATVRLYHHLSNGSWSMAQAWATDELRVRDIETGDVNGDSHPDIVAGTHENGVVAVIEFRNRKWLVTEIDRQEDTYIHEIELADIDGDGTDEIFATPTRPNMGIGERQEGSIVMYKWNGSDYERTCIECFNQTSAKAIAAGDLDGDGRKELVAAVNAVSRKKDAVGSLMEFELETPVRIVLYRFSNAGVQKSVIAEISDIGARGLSIGDADNDGRNEIVVGTATKGLWLVWHDGGRWRIGEVDDALSGNVRSVLVGDIDGDSLNEIIANSDMLSEINIYRHSWEGWSRESAPLDIGNRWVWSMRLGDADNE